jgi:hypothetical protein
MPHCGFTVEVGEYDFVGEERDPFEGGGAVVVGAANQFVLAIGDFYQSGLAELADEAGAETLENDVF